MIFNLKESLCQGLIRNGGLENIGKEVDQSGNGGLYIGVETRVGVEIVTC